MQPEIAALVVAAGAGRRIGGPKALLDWAGDRFLDRILGALREAGAAARVLVVLGAEADRVHAACAGALAASTAAGLPAEAVVNPAWDEGGMLSSLITGLGRLTAVGGTGAPAAVLHWPVDHPAVRPDTLRRLIDAFAADHPPVVVPRHRGRRGHPVLFSAEIFDALRAAPPEEGARAVVRGLGGRVRQVEVDDPGVLVDVDTPADLARLRNGG